MRRWVQIFGGLLLAVWLPATQHCRLEGLAEWVGADPCCPSAPAPQSAQPCCDVLCAGLEQGWHRVEDGASEAPEANQILPKFLLGWEPGGDAARELAENLPRGSCPCDPVTALVRCWRFVCRTALPPRAPDIRS